jgi:hypothetical protein
MHGITRCLAAVLVLSFLPLSAAPVLAVDHKASRPGGAAPAASSGKEPVFPSMPAPGKKVPFGTSHYLIYGFDKKPKLGTVIVKIAIFSNNGDRDTSFEVLGDSGMPSMKGAHETGEQPFRLSKKGEYLLPVNIVMPGDWEVRITIKKAGNVIFRGSHQFDV